MKIKKYVAPTLKEASEQMKRELGDQAIILSTRILEGESTYGSRKLFEITSGIEEDQITIKVKKPAQKDTEEADAARYAREIKELASKVYNERPNILLDLDETATEQSDDEETTTTPLRDELKQVIEKLSENEVNKDVIALVLNQIDKNNSFINKGNINSYVVSSIGGLIPTINFEVRNKNKTKVVALVGPTGVGKTTSIAKLAVISKILHNLDIGLISIDTYRLGALDQLRIFSEVSNIDMLVAYEPEEMPKLMSSFKKKDIVFIDTVGRSQNNADSLLKTKNFLDVIDVDEIVLVLSATNSTKNLLSITEKFKVFGYDSLLYTKIDEAVTYGNILNVSSKTNVPTMFLTNGQVIPDDIISADAGMIAKLIYTGVLGS